MCLNKGYFTIYGFESLRSHHGKTAWSGFFVYTDMPDKYTGKIRHA